MARIKLQSEDTDNPNIQTIFSEIRERAGKVPAAYRAFAKHEHILQANWNRTKNILEKGNLPIELKEMIAARVSAENGCQFCLNIHSKNLINFGLSQDEVKAVSNGDITDKKINKVLHFVTMASIYPHKITKLDYSELDDFGYSEEDILEMLTVMEMYSGYNKIIVALGIKDFD